MGRPILLTLLLVALVLPAGAQEAFLHHRLAASIVVADPGDAAERIAKWIEAEGGYFVLMTAELFTARLPAEALKPFRGFLEEVALEVKEMTPRAEDLRDAFVAAEAALRSRKEILGRNLQYLGRVDVAGTLAIERELAALMKEIEGLKGKLRKIETDRRLASVEVRLAFFERSLPRNLPSSFPWINSVDFYSFVRGEFR